MCPSSRIVSWDTPLVDTPDPKETMNKKTNNVALRWKNHCWYATYRVPVMDPQLGKIVVQRNRRTNTTNKAVAQKLGNKWRDEELFAFRSGGAAGESSFVPLRDHSLTCGQLVQHYLATTRVPSARNVANRFLIAVSEGSGIVPADPARAGAIRLSQLSEGMMLAFRDQLHVRPLIGKPLGRAGKKIELRNDTSMNTMVRIAKSIFSERALESYRGLKLKLPLAQINTWKGVTMLKEDKDAQRYRAVSNTTLMNMDDSTEMMLRLSRWHFAKNNVSYARQWLNAYGTYEIMRRLGLRNKEVENLRWDWFVTRPEDDILVLALRNYGYWKPKGRSRDLPISQEFFAKLTDLFGPAIPGEEGYLLAGTKTDRWLGTHHNVNLYIRRFIAGTNAAARKRARLTKDKRQKASYNLRKQFGSQSTLLYGPEVTYRMMGHADFQTTLDSYADILKMASVKPL
jgi:hypothetical protein